jgi:hypothetical protein
MRVFVSSENVERSPARLLLERLRQEGWAVDHSPRNPAEGKDPRWMNWYERGCREALQHADVFIAVVTKTWESTWMAQESWLAMQEPGQRYVPRCYYWNPEGIAVHAQGLTPYLRERLPDDLEAVIAALRGNVAEPGGAAGQPGD